MRRRTALTLVAVLAVAAVAVYALTASGSGSAATVKLRTTALGRILVDSEGHTLYLFEKDRRGAIACAGACAKNWPPLIVAGRPRAGSGARAARLGATRRPDGRVQATYGGHPLYTFAGDAGQAGRTKGQGADAFGAEWYVVGADGAKVDRPAQVQGAPATTAPRPSPYGY